MLGDGKDHPKTSRFHSEIRRNFIRYAPTSVLQEMRPMLNQNSKQREEDARKPIDLQRLPPARRPKGEGNLFEFSVRDHPTQPAKKGFRVQVPKRLLFYTILVFFILPIFVFVFFEISKSKKGKHPPTYHKYDVSHVLSHLMSDEDQETEGTNETSFESILALSKTILEGVLPDQISGDSETGQPHHDVEQTLANAINSILGTNLTSNSVSSFTGSQSEQQKQVSGLLPQLQNITAEIANFTTVAAVPDTTKTSQKSLKKLPVGGNKTEIKYKLSGGGVPSSKNNASATTIKTVKTEPEGGLSSSEESGKRRLRTMLRNQHP